MQAIKGLIVVVAVLFCATSMAFAHAGHTHAQSSVTSSVTSVDSVAAKPQANAEISGIVVQKASNRSNEPVTSGLSIQSVVVHSGGAVCPPGTCCCQGASSCGMSGHCCTSMMPDNSKWLADFGNNMRYHLARLGWVYLDIVNGLDRPPKA